MVKADSSVRISVAICTRNGAGFIASQLRSILGQSRAPDQIVLSDDSSTDETVAIARGVFAEFPGVVEEVQIVENPVALGVTKNFESAVLACNGDLVALSDQDDAWHPERLAVIEREFLERPDLDLLHGDARLVSESGATLSHTLFDALGVTTWEKREIRDGRAFAVFLRRNLATGATVVFRRGLLEIATPFPPEWVHDEWLAIIASATGRVDVIEQPLVDYRQHGANQIGAQKLSLGGKFGRMLEPRQARNERLARSFEILVSRLEDLGPRIPPAKLTQARGKRAHELVRVALPVSRLRRIGPVLRERASGGYRSFGRGTGDVVRDLVQPAK